MMDTAVEILLVGPVVLVWIVALRDGFRRTAGHRRLRPLVLVPLAVFPPLAVPYLLTRTPTSIRRGSVRRDDPRAELIDRLEVAAEDR